MSLQATLQQAKTCKQFITVFSSDVQVSDCVEKLLYERRKKYCLKELKERFSVKIPEKRNS